MPRVLVLTANSKTTPLDLSSEVERIRDALGENTNFNLRPESEVQAKNFVSLLTEYEADIIHFACHGGTDQRIVLRSGDKDDAPLAAAAFAKILSRLRVRPRMIVLNACHTADFAEELKQYVPVLVGTKGEIHDKAAGIFAAKFYGHLADEDPKSVATAFELATVDVEVNGFRQKVFELQKKDGFDAEKLFFFGRPQLMASFVLDKNGRPKRNRDKEYRIELRLRGVEEHIDTVTYQVCHKSFKKKFWEIRREESSEFVTERFSSYGDVTIRVVAWAKKRGVGVESSLAAALQRNYDDAPDQDVASALERIKRK